MNWYKKSNIKNNEINTALHNMRKELDNIYDNINHQLEIDKRIQVDSYDNIAKLKLLNKIDKIIEKYFADYGWSARIL